MRGNQGSWSPGYVVGPYRASVFRAFPGPSPMRGSVGSWSPRNVIGPCRVLRVLGLSRPRTGALKGPATCARSPGTSSRTRWCRRPGSGEPGLFALTWEGTGRLRGHRRPQSLADVCLPCVRVHGGKASMDRGPCKHGPSYVCMRSNRAF